MKQTQFPVVSRETVYAQQCVTIEPLQVQEEYVRVPSDLAHWNGKWTDAIDEDTKAAAERKELKATITLEIRWAKENQLEYTSADKRTWPVKALTEAVVDSIIQLDPRYLVTLDRERLADVEKTRIAGVIEAIRAKKEMLISLGAHQRLEMERDPQVNQRNR